MPKRIMVIDGDQDILDLYNELLNEAGYEVRMLNLDRVKLETITQFKPDLLITDIKLGNEEEGLFFFQEIRLNPATTTIPIILCTGNVRKVNELEEQLKAKKITTIIKPFDLQELIKAVEAAFASSPHI